MKIQSIGLLVFIGLTLILGYRWFSQRPVHIDAFFKEYSPPTEVLEKLSRGFEINFSIEDPGAKPKKCLGLVSAEGFVLHEIGSGNVELQNKDYYAQAFKKQRTSALTNLKQEPSPATSCIFYSGFYDTQLRAGFADIGSNRLATCDEYADEQVDGIALKRLRLNYGLSVNNLSADARCDYFFDPQRLWRCVEVRRGIVGNATVQKLKLSYLNDESIIPQVIRMSTITNSKETVGRVYTVSSLEEKAIDGSDLQISQFGLPEPNLSKGSSISYYILGVAILSVGTLLVLNRRRVNR